MNKLPPAAREEIRERCEKATEATHADDMQEFLANALWDLPTVLAHLEIALTALHLFREECPVCKGLGSVKETGRPIRPCRNVRCVRAREAVVCVVSTTRTK